MTIYSVSKKLDRLSVDYNPTPKVGFFITLTLQKVTGQIMKFKIDLIFNNLLYS